MKAAAIILARGGSKGIPRKNLRKVCGKSLLAWAIEAAQQAATIGRVYVSTEDDQIATLAMHHGAEVINRPTELATDAATSASGVLHALQFIDPVYDIICIVQTTTMPQVPEDIDRTVQILDEQHAASSITVSPVAVDLWCRDDTGYGQPITNPKQLRRQDYPPQYQVNGACFAVRRNVLERTGEIKTGRIALVVCKTPWIDIHQPSDLVIAEALQREYGNV